MYEYECQACHHRFEKIQKFSDKPIKKCPHCGKSKVEKLISKSSIQFKGTGWYVTDYAGKKADGTTDSKSEGKTGEKSEDKSESKTEGASEGKAESKDGGKTETKSESKPEASDKSSKKKDSKKTKS